MRAWAAAGVFVMQLRVRAGDRDGRAGVWAIGADAVTTCVALLAA